MENTQATHVVSSEGLEELVKQIDPAEALDNEVKEVLFEIADDFIESVTSFACALAKHRGSDTLDVSDLKLHLERNWDIHVPGFGGVDMDVAQIPPVTDAHRQRQAAAKAVADSILP
ncbi:transcription initiation factor TFIID subunit 12 [Thecamonas trahens ATCC 50062]|uniref:Transcription initiation factor TFIID subunit 12 n=1 Tax=Thecamonas trahens ATCC 50062 TaxID=461836 RepID=A0A0L0DDN6_THETB|nr:transcription initiation factor TFIID subunit 12 [Thecamonas trahens ATCC 50062]KNC50424.1 transcription initiation factor TFIID subunit 12 [Thecamonas trahens ATCC 50062]|eukprot:XP_013756965.1 transcription initiation factor TFIID subunit 12 [Thecamonas trahens ATCC 50062]